MTALHAIDVEPGLTVQLTGRIARAGGMVEADGIGAESLGQARGHFAPARAPIMIVREAGVACVFPRAFRIKPGRTIAAKHPPDIGARVESPTEIAAVGAGSFKIVEIEDARSIAPRRGHRV